MSNFGATILDAEGLRLSKDEIAFFREANPFGFILFARNLQSPDQIRALCEDMRNAVGREAPITIDQEGGRVQRLRPPLARDWPAPLDHALQLGANATRGFYLRNAIIGAELRALGIDSNCAPMVDVTLPNTHEFLKNRCYSGDPAVVAVLGRAAADGLLDAGVLPVAKHIPGHGRGLVDSHYGLPRVDADLEALQKTDFVPFKALADLPMAMTAHIVYSALDDQPATTSRKVIELIRNDIGCTGLLMSDDLSMEALDGSYRDRTRAALDAGCDIALICNRSLVDREKVAQEAGTMSEAAQMRAEAALDARKAPQQALAAIDIDALTRELETLEAA